MHLSVEIVKAKNQNDEPCVVEVYLDKEGLDTLIYNLNEVKKDLSEGEHVHLKSESWGGSELSDEKKGSNNISVKHLKIVSCQKT